MLKFNSTLYRGCTTEAQRKERREFLVSHLPLLTLLHGIAECAMNEASKSHIQDGYDSPAWPFKQADLNGQVRAYTHMLEILTTNEDNHV